ncbi:hypothetical protein [Nocardia neocaledoniensis]|uniref:hypothetical protein n=1 Tax=Nocardia neocaledoniensis TaxID=236511 RepID=UPI0024587EE6|nr:hypothetical protein [Nocardia neocaledoniensis]
MTDEPLHPADALVPRLIESGPIERLGVGDLQVPLPDWVAPEPPSWLRKVDPGTDVADGVDAAERAVPDVPYTVPARSVAEVQARIAAHKARALETFRHRDDNVEVIRARVAELFGPVSATGTLTAPPDSTAVGATTGAAAGIALGGTPSILATPTVDGILGEIGQGKGAAFKRSQDRRLP